MPDVEFTATVPLGERIVLTLLEGQDWPVVSWSLENGDRARVAIEITQDQLGNLLQGRSTAFATYPIETLRVDLTIDVTADDLERLEDRHPTAERFVGDGRERQEAPELATRVATDLCEAATRIVDQVRYLYGQFWLNPVTDGGHAGNFVLGAETRWRKRGGEWTQFFPVRRAMVGSFVLTRADAYLELADYALVKQSIEQSTTTAPDAFALIADARARFREGHASLAMIQLGIAVEWAAIVFVDRHLRGAIPDHCLEKVKEAPFARLLEDWVLPLARRALPDLVREDWPAIQEVRTLRGQAAHANPEPSDLDRIRRRFETLATASARSTARLIGASIVPKTPLYWIGGWATAWSAAEDASRA